MLVISPQKTDYSKELKNNHQLDFELLTDKDNALAKQLGISFELQEYVIPTYNSLGIKLSDYNDNDNNELPIPAVFVIDTDYRITYKFVDSNYMNRINIQELIEQL
ncbi:redoxin domain-containing protein [Flavobacterium sp. KMS]|uniref:redoxin domain-containing protein n=1 Tax=Flavobacterium sp. KMS TaxID=1566023 RepID=UPI000A4FB497|nr:redoxin domain-containing protein [Flavobacterium sp. KMS]